MATIYVAGVRLRVCFGRSLHLSSMSPSALPNRFFSSPAVAAVLFTIFAILSCRAQEFSAELMTAAKAGNAEAQYQLSRCYMLGKGVAEDHAKAAKWETSAAERNHTEAQFVLGTRYYVGLGMPKSHVKAWKWISLAKEAGHVRAGQILKVVEREMNEQQLAEARILASAFEPVADKPGALPQPKARLPDAELKAYRLLEGSGGAGSAFVIRYGNRLVGVSSLHQFEGKTPDKLVDAKGGEILLNQAKTLRQLDVQATVLTDQESKTPYLNYKPVFELTSDEPLWVYDASGNMHEARLDFTTLASMYRSSQGPQEIHAILTTPIVAAGSSGSPVIQLSTGQVVGVLLGANDASKATRLSFETLCLPDLAPKPPAPAAPVYADSKQANAYESLAAFSKKVPAAHWKASDMFFKAWKVENPDTLENYVKNASASAIEVKPAAEAGWQGTIKLVDKTAPDLEWTYQLMLKGEVWSLVRLWKKENGNTTDSFEGDALMRKCWTSAIKEAAQQK